MLDTGNQGLRGPIVSEAVTQPCLPQITELLQIELQGFLSYFAFPCLQIALSLPAARVTSSVSPFPIYEWESEPERKRERKTRDGRRHKKDGSLLVSKRQKRAARKSETDVCGKHEREKTTGGEMLAKGRRRVRESTRGKALHSPQQLP